MPRFCSACGAAIGRTAPVACPSCGREHWLNASPAGAALVVAGERLLLTRRALEPWRDRWCAPSGFCEGHEHPADAAVRESLEEVGLRVRVVGYLGHWIDEYRPGGDGGVEPRYCAVSYYHAVPVDGTELALDAAEVADARWFAADELPDALAPAVNGGRIFGAWRDAFRAGRLEAALPDL